MSLYPIFLATLFAGSLPAQALDTTRTRRLCATDSTVMHFPEVTGTNLEGRRFALPRDFEAEFNVVLVAFQRDQQADVDTWVPFLRTLATTHANVRAYEIPTLGRRYLPMRRFIDGGMARGIPELGTRETTITLYIDKAPFKRALGIRDENVIMIALVARDGRVLWSQKGRYTSAVAAQLTDALNATTVCTVQ